MAYLLTDEDLESVSTLSARAAATELSRTKGRHVGKSTVIDARKRLSEATGPHLDAENVPLGYKFEKRLDGTIEASTRPSEEPQTLEDAYALLESKTVDISGHDISYGYVERELATGKITYQYTIKAVPKKITTTEHLKLDADELIKALEGFTYVPAHEEYGDEVFVICPADLQTGKTSFNGGTPELIERVMQSWERATDWLKDHPVGTIVIAELGDVVENFYNTSSQRETNDLDITNQIRTARRLLLEGIKRLAPFADRIIYVAVPSNHGSVRVGFKNQAGDSHNDWGIEILEQLRDACNENPSLAHVEFYKPDPMYESLAIDVNGTKLGFVHGHQAKSSERVGEWWKGQDHGRQPTWDADILLSGHWHSLKVYHSGNGRYVMIAPSSDNGSDWFTNITGEYSETGMLVFTVKDGKWSNMDIF